MYQFFVLLLLLVPQLSSSQITETTTIEESELDRNGTEIHQIKALDVTIGLGIGNKSHFGNFGLTSNLYLTNKLSLKLSCGAAAFNYGGFIASGGAEFIAVKFKRSQFSIGSVYSYIGGSGDILGDDDSNDYIWFHTTSIQCIRSYLNYAFNRDRVLYTFEIGSSFTLSPINYSFSGPGVPSQSQIKNIERGLGSGWLATITINGLFSLKHN